jgi:hypothetical protein
VKKKQQRHPKAKQFDKLYRDIFKTMEDLRSNKITPTEANKRAKAFKEKAKKI